MLVVTKDQPTESNTGYAQGGVAVAMGTDDEPRLHLEDTLAAGAGLVTEAAARVLVEEGPDRIRELLTWGARFDREDGRVHLTREAAHSRSRVLHALGDATGFEIVRTLLHQAQRTERLVVRSFACSTDLEVEDGRVVGCRFLNDDGAEVRVLARATLLATGGAGQVFAETTNPEVATGDGMAMAFRAGASLLDMEFVQFHPTALAIAGAPRFLISEAVRGEGGRLLNGRGDRFVDELLPRDQVARAIAAENLAGRGPVRLDVTHLDAGAHPHAVPAHPRDLPPPRRRHHERAGARDPGRALRDGRGGERPPGPGERSAASTLRERSPATGSTARTAWPATLSWRGSCSGPDRPRRWSGMPFRCRPAGRAPRA